METMIINTLIHELKAHGPANLFGLDEVAEKTFGNDPDEGLIHLFSVGSTGCLLMIDDEDIKDTVIDSVIRLIPWRDYHRHPGNAFAHLRSSMLGNEAWLSVGDGGIDFINMRPFLLENTAGNKRRPIAVTKIKGTHMDEHLIEVESNGWIDIIDLSLKLRGFISDNEEGLLFIEAASPKTSLVTIEYEPALLLDTADFFARLLDDVAPANKAQVAASLLTRSIAVPFREGRSANGVWQQLALIDFGEAGAKQIRIKKITSDK